MTAQSYVRKMGRPRQGMAVLLLSMSVTHRPLAARVREEQEAVFKRKRDCVCLRVRGVGCTLTKLH